MVTAGDRKGPRLPLYLIAAEQALSAASNAVLRVLNEGAARASVEAGSAAKDDFARLRVVGFGVRQALGAMLLGALILLVLRRPWGRGRALAVGSLAVVGAGQIVNAMQWAELLPNGSFTTGVLWFFVSPVGRALALLSVAVPARRGIPLIAAWAALEVSAIGIWCAMMSEAARSTLVDELSTAVSTFSFVAPLACAGVALALARADDAGLRVPSRATPYRVLGWASLARGVFLALLQGVFLFAAAQKAFGTAATASWIGLAASLLAGGATAFALDGMLRLPHALRGDAPGFVLGALVLGAVAEIVATGVVVGFCHQLDSLAHPGSSKYWGSGGGSQEAGVSLLQWLGQGSLVVGVLAGAALYASVRRAAREIDRHDLATVATRGLWFLVAFGVTLPVFFWMASNGTSMLFVPALALFALAIASLVSWLVVTFGVARAMETTVVVENRR